MVFIFVFTLSSIDLGINCYFHIFWVENNLNILNEMKINYLNVFKTKQYLLLHYINISYYIIVER